MLTASRLCVRDTPRLALHAEMIGQGTPSNDGASAGLILVLLALYFVPTIVAVARKVPNLGSVLVIDLFLGWTVIGWVVALAMAARTVPTTTQPPMRRPPPRSSQSATPPSAGPSPPSVTGSAPVPGPDAVRTCPYCKEAMQRHASVCPHCRRESQAWTYENGRWWTTDSVGTRLWLDERQYTWHDAEPSSPG
jgi:hypothetical protein